MASPQDTGVAAAKPRELDLLIPGNRGPEWRRERGFVPFAAAN